MHIENQCIVCVKGLMTPLDGPFKMDFVNGHCIVLIEIVVVVIFCRGISSRH